MDEVKQVPLTLMLPIGKVEVRKAEYGNGFKANMAGGKNFYYGKAAEEAVGFLIMEKACELAEEKVRTCGICKGFGTIFAGDGEIPCPECGWAASATPVGVDKGRKSAPENDKPRTCRVCGCTDMQPCEDGRWWVEDDLCSGCCSGDCPECDLTACAGMEGEA